MPVYLYRNLVTGETFEYEQRITDDALTVDPVSGEAVKRLVQPVGIAFKGSGFYVNDVRKGDSGKVSTPNAKPAEASPTAGAGSSSAASASSSTSSSTPAASGSGASNSAT